MAKHQDEVLIGPWKQIHGAIWLIGLAVLFWTGWWWPGILVLIAISSITQAVIQLAVPKASVPEWQTQIKTDWLPAQCPQCAAPLSTSEVKWTSATTADCPYCGSNLKASDGAP